MSDNIALSVPGISVNNVPIAIVPDSYKSVLGAGEITVRAASSGGNGVVSIHTENAETKVSKMTWQMYNTGETKRLVQQWKRNIGANAIVAQQSGITPDTMQHGSMKNDPEFEGSADGKVTIEFSGDPLSSNS